MSDLQKTPWAPAKDLSATAFKGEALSLFELYREVVRSGQTIIENRTFTDCRLEGPAVVAVLGGVNFDATDFGYNGGDIGRLVWRTASTSGVVGAIPFRSCQFIGCSFFATGFTGPEAFLQQILALKTAP
ncbi:MAG: hypothetical protein HY859_05795 [Caulobacterales bacterium]|nr:hypothetical protein [Caulobacterales bacterium]